MTWARSWRIFLKTRGIKGMGKRVKQLAAPGHLKHAPQRSLHRILKAVERTVRVLPSGKQVYSGKTPHPKDVKNQIRMETPLVVV
ncbi:hypothetical protein NDU88_002844 [Pleurodeles waltl]|uniref:Uncharacterized protein n=1 Tax=Pleurodeles waltl TaxID=8319 RepID=A0AAV7NHK0_PLEWA|nr:hypothetical protein NDU88_002844 [Pleurodeles waltl]